MTGRHASRGPPATEAVSSVAAPAWSDTKATRAPSAGVEREAQRVAPVGRHEHHVVGAALVGDEEERSPVRLPDGRFWYRNATPAGPEIVDPARRSRVRCEATATTCAGAAP